MNYIFKVIAVVGGWIKREEEKEREKKTLKALEEKIDPFLPIPIYSWPLICNPGQDNLMDLHCHCRV